MKALAILGPGAHDRSVSALRAAGYDLEICRESGAGLADLTVILGGDGTIHRFLPQIMRAKAPVLVVPDGSGNDLARALNIGSVANSLELAKQYIHGQCTSKEIDIGVITDFAGRETPFCCVGGIGLDAIAAEFANRMPRWLRSHGGYLLSMAHALFAPPALRLRISALGVEGGYVAEIKQDSCLFSFANTPTFGGGLPIAPQARVDDGQLDCVLVKAMSTLHLIQCVPSLLIGKVLGLKEVSFMRAETLRVETDPPTWVYADGEPVCQTPVDVRVRRRALRVLSNL